MSKTILFIDDDPNVQELCRMAVARVNLLQETLILGDGEQALDFLLCRGEHEGRMRGNPSVIFLDLNMPKFDGLEVLREIRSRPEMSQIPVIMLTGSRDEQELVKSYDLGVNAFVVKPDNLTQFVHAVADLGSFWATINVPPPN